MKPWERNKFANSLDILLGIFRARLRDFTPVGEVSLALALALISDTKPTSECEDHCSGENSHAT